MYDKAHIGKKIATGGVRKVYMYETDHVIKISSPFLGVKLRNKLGHDYLVCKKYFPAFVVETIDVTPTSERTHVEIQPFIPGERLRKHHLRNEKTRLQLLEIQNGIERMEADGYPPIDLIGNGGILSECLSNIIVDTEGNLNIVDAAILEAKTVRPIGIFLELLMPFAKARQKKLLNRFLK